jgi:type VI secretion system secreted protein Hcp
MAEDYFLKLDGIPGESLDKAHAAEIDLESFSWGMTTSRVAGSGQASGKTQFQDFSFVQKTNKASPLLFERATNGKNIKSGVLTVRRPAGKGGGVEFLKITFSNVRVISLQQSADSGDHPVEEVGVAFDKINIEYHPVQSDGTAGAGVQAGFDIKNNLAAP